MNTDLATINHSGIARPEDIGGYSPMRPLDVYSKGLADEAPRVDAIATISCGRRNEKGYPQAAKKGDPQHIFIHDLNDRAKGLTEALIKGDAKRLTIAFPFDNPAHFIQQRFSEYTATSLKAYGDEKSITEIVTEGAGDQQTVKHVTYMANTPDYDRVVARCKVSVSVYFALASWTADGPRVEFPDGLGMYRLRFTSRHSLRNLLASIDYVAKFTRGRIAGIPFNLGVDFREVAAPNGVKRTIPVFTFVMSPPGGITSLTFRQTATAALAQGAALQLAPPTSETWETEILDGPVGDDVDAPSQDEAAMMARGGRCDAALYKRLWFATVRGTSLADEDGRRAFLDQFTDRETSHLAQFLEMATTAEADRLITTAIQWLEAKGEIDASGEATEPAERTPLTSDQASASMDNYDRMMAEGDAIDAGARQLLDPEPPVIDAEARTVEPDAQIQAAKAVIDDALSEDTPEKSERRLKTERRYIELHGEAMEWGIEAAELDPDWPNTELSERWAALKAKVDEAKTR